ncbi:MAG: rod-binding protein [Thiohalorhabdaceae bacterium]
MELAINPKVSPDGATPREKLKGLSQEFESLFLSQMFSAMRDTIPEGEGVVDTGNAGEMYQDLFDRQVASMGTDGGGMGVGKALYAYLEQGMAEPDSDQSGASDQEQPVGDPPALDRQA